MARSGMHAGWVLVALFIVAGCGPKDRDLAPCGRDADCAADEVCDDGYCRKIECRKNSECGQGERCQDYQCVPEADCERDEDCPEGQHCQAGSCVANEGCASDEDCVEPTPICDVPSGECLACLPVCTGVCCGDDGCGGTCPDDCDATGQTCDTESCTCQGVCVPDCADKECGPDGCGQTCGEGCSDGEVCNAEGRCECRPSCAGKSCGPDGCGGECSPGCEPDETCTADGTCLACQPECGERVCGLEPACGTSCGDCPAGESCNLSGQCGPWCQAGESRCATDGHGFESCGPDPVDPEINTFGNRIPCQLGDSCEAGACTRQACLETEMLLLLDRSSSMLTGDTWDWVTDSLLGKLREREGRNYFGYREFPSGGGCSVGDLLSMSKDNVNVIEASMHAPEMDSATPIAAALAGFTDQFGDPNDGQAVILVTDGDETCGTQVEAVAAAGALWRAGIRVHVLAVTHTANRTFLDMVAQAGGTEQSRLVTTGVELTAALEAIFGEQTACRCLPEDAYCHAGEVFGCSADEMEFEWKHGCPLGCDASGLACQTCAPGQTECRQGKLWACRPDGLDFELDHVCEQGCLNGLACRGEMVHVTAGGFVRGSLDSEGEEDERPRRTLYLDAFYIDALEATNAEYAACVTAGACTAPATTSSATRESYYGNPAFGDHPVIHVTWYQARDYCHWQGKRLPSEAEWERAARGASPSTRAYPWGAVADCSRANTESCTGDTVAVGSLPDGAAPSGAMDMAGNVYEWVHDYYDSTYYATAPEENPLGPDPSLFSDRVRRGGSFDKEAFYARCANRASTFGSSDDIDVGIRCARTPPGGDHDGDGWPPDEGDCDDNDPDANPGLEEACADDIDNDCDGETDEECPEVFTYYNDSDYSIPDASTSAPGSWVYASMSVSECGTLVGVEAHVQITHTYIGDLVVKLESPAGDLVVLHNRDGGSADSIDELYQTTEFNGSGMCGTWYLWVRDEASQDTGTLTHWHLELSREPS